ncbi:MAG: phosphate acyltransferase PlsX [Nitrospirae bacterium]|nr:phosphate acyltransferase PlsX [Nitrospirota bacterium]
MRIALDGMGGDKAPQVNVEGAVLAAKEMDLEVVLVGNKAIIKKELAKHETGQLKISLEEASEVIGMDESPIRAMRRKKDSSIVKAIGLLRKGKVEAVVSAGNTGATVAAAKIYLSTIPGVDRAAIATLMPTPTDPSVLLDAGANVDSRPRNLYQFAVMGSIYAEHILGKAKPQVGLLSIGHEKSKGNELTKEVYRLLKDSSLNFAGNIEGRDIFSGRVEVIVCDGFIGNVVLKACESLAETLESSLRQELKRSFWTKLGVLLSKKAYRDFQKKVDYAERGGAPLLGVEGVCIISHGSSSPKAIKNAIKVASEFVKHRVNEHIGKAIAE